MLPVALLLASLGWFDVPPAPPRVRPPHWRSLNRQERRERYHQSLHL